MRFWLSRAMIVGLGIAILIVSLARASLEIMAQGDNSNNLGNKFIEYNVTFDDGEIAKGIYKLPETGMLPDNAFYGVKKIRDYLWLTFSGGIKKIKIALLMADKSATEVEELVAKDKSDLALASGNEAVEKLEYADNLIHQIELQNDQIKQLHYQLFWAGYAYKEIFLKIENTFEVDKVKLAKLINRIDDWNKTQKKSKSSWDF